MPRKERSPNYPGLSLEAAISAIRMVQGIEKRGTAPTLSVAKALGHENLSGPALTKIAALRQYGLLEDVAPGKVKVSDLAMAILLRHPDDYEYLRALRDAALRPSLFADLYREYAQASEQTLRYHLIQDRSFSEEGAMKVIKTFRATLAFAKLDEPGYDGEKKATGVVEGEPPSRPDIPEDLRRRIDPLSGIVVERVREIAKVYTYPLPDGSDAKVSFERRPTRETAQALIDQLTSQKKYFKSEPIEGVEIDYPTEGRSSR
ncbi:MAG: hypothetical protein WB438_02985 [Candidatus Cybelea sp.]